MWGADDPNDLGAEHLVEAGRELGVSVSDKELDSTGPLGEHEAQIPSLLSDPARQCCIERVRTEPRRNLVHRLSRARLPG
jgi:hypothetical protein